ncbi:MAG: porin [Idiomarina sp.]|nr:porin [Idiomarina sp.]
MMKSIQKSRISYAVTGALFSVAALGMAASANANTEFRVGDTDFRFGGYIKLDAMVSRFDSGTIESGSIGRDFYIPGLTPVGADTSNTVTDFHARESRFYFGTSHTLDNGETISGYFEFDFLGTPGGDKRVTNSYSPRVRHAFIDYRNWRVGQFWSNFQETAIIPEAPDFVGVADGIVFTRQPQVRYTFDNGLSVSVEAPETTVTPYLGDTSRITTGDTAMPDLTARWGTQVDNVYFSIAGIYRRLELQNYNTIINGVDGTVSDTENAFGASLAMKWDIGPHDIRASVVHGSGLGRYVGINVSNGAVITDDFNLDALDVTGYSFAYRHVWSDQWRTNLIFSRADIGNAEEFTGIFANDSTQRMAVNMMYQVNERLVIGGELSRANRELISGADGNMDRLQFSAIYNF